jgi:hypothetical protein
MHRRSGGFICVNLAWTIASVATSSPIAAQGSLRQLVCRGKAGIALRVHRDPDKPSFGMPFSLRSKDGFVFMFVVHGEIEVTRQ